MQHAPAGNDIDELAEREFSRLEEQGGERDQDNQRQPKKAHSQRHPEDGDDASSPPNCPRPPHSALWSVRIDFIKHAAVAEVQCLRLLPAAERVVYREELDLGEGILVVLCNGGVTRAVMVLRRNFLSLRRIDEI